MKDLVTIDLGQLQEIFPGTVHTGLTDRQMLIAAAQHEVVQWIAKNCRRDNDPLEVLASRGVI